MLGNTEKRFLNRRDAGEQLAHFLKNRIIYTHALVVGVPRGGVEVAYYVALGLGLPFTIIVSKKLPFPGNSELAFGAVSEYQQTYVNPKARETLSDQTITDIIYEQTREVNRRVKLYRQGNPLPKLNGKYVIIVDAGIATGATLVPVLRLCRQQGAKHVTLAAPVSGRYYDDPLHEADAMEILEQPQPFYGVGQVYENFGDSNDQQMLDLLNNAPNLLK